MNRSGFITFVRERSKPTKSAGKPQRDFDYLLNGSSDWSILFDYDSNPMVFPINICATDARPDIVIWSKESKRVIIIELTVPAEESITDAHHRKLLKYEPLLAMCLSQSWQAVLLPIEVGCKGFVGFSLTKCCKKLGLSKLLVSRISKLLSRVALPCSYLIFLSRNNRAWNPIDLHINLDNTNNLSMDPNSADFASVL
jgi:hypothetical protein